MVFKAQICNKKLTVKTSQVEGGREGVKEVWTFSQVSPFFSVMASLNRNNELNKEFYFAHPETKVKINNIYNMSFSGSSLWDLSGNDVISLENTYNL